MQRWLSRTWQVELVSRPQRCAATGWATARRPLKCCVGWPKSCVVKRNDLSGWLMTWSRKQTEEGAMPKKRKCWSHSEGEKGYTVTVYERQPGALLYARAFDQTLGSGRGGYRRVSLKYRDR